MKIYENLDINDLDEEVWKVVENFTDYWISNLGRVKSFIKWHGTEIRILKQNKNSTGYFCVNLWKNGKKKTKKVHILVYETFHDYKLKVNECVHHDKDWCKENNNFDNLIMMTKKEHRRLHMIGENNSMFGNHFLKSKETKIKISESLKGDKNPNFKLTNQKRTDIETDIEKRIYTQTEIAKKHGVSQVTISNIKLKKI